MVSKTESDKVYESNFIKQHLETVVMVWNFQNADCNLRKKYCVIYLLSFPIKRGSSQRMNWTELNWTELTCTKLTHLHAALLVTRVSVTKLIGKFANCSSVPFSSVHFICCEHVFMGRFLHICCALLRERLELFYQRSAATRMWTTH